MEFLDKIVNVVLGEDDATKANYNVRLLKRIESDEDYEKIKRGKYDVIHGPKNVTWLGPGRFVKSRPLHFDVKNSKLQCKDGIDRYCNWDLDLVPATVDGVMEYYTADLDRFKKLLDKYKDIVTPEDEVIRSLNKSGRRSSIGYFIGLFEKSKNSVIGEFNEVSRGSDIKDGFVTSIVNTSLARYCTNVEPFIVENMHIANGKDVIKKYCVDNGITTENYFCDLYEMIQLEMKIRTFNKIGYYPLTAKQKNCSKDPLIEEMETKIDVAEKQGALIKLEGENALAKQKYENKTKMLEKQGELKRQELENEVKIKYTKDNIEASKGVNPIIAVGAMGKDLGSVHYIEAGETLNKLGEFIAPKEPTKKDVSESVLSSMKTKTASEEAKTDGELFEEKTESEVHDYSEVDPEKEIFTDKDTKEEEPVVEETPVVVEESAPVVTEETTPAVVEESAPVVTEETTPVVVEEPTYTFADISSADSYLEGESTIEELPVDENEIGKTPKNLGQFPGTEPKTFI